MILVLWLLPTLPELFTETYKESINYSIVNPEESLENMPNTQNTKLNVANRDVLLLKNDKILNLKTSLVNMTVVQSKQQTQKQSNMYS